MRRDEESRREEEGREGRGETRRVRENRREEEGKGGTGESEEQKGKYA